MPSSYSNLLATPSPPGASSSSKKSPAVNTPSSVASPVSSCGATNLSRNYSSEDSTGEDSIYTSGDELSSSTASKLSRKSSNRRKRKKRHKKPRSAPKNKGPITMVFIGDGAVGKTSLIASFVSNSPPLQYTPTVFDDSETEILYHNEKTKKEELYQLKILDTAGQDEYSRVRKLAYPSTDVFVLVIDVTEEDSFANVHQWVLEVENYVPEENRRIILVGNKIDLEDKREITLEGGRRKAHQSKLKGYVECSAYSREGLKELFDYAVSVVIDDDYLLDYQKQWKKKEKKDCAVM